MGRREALNALLVSILGSRNVYFQPPTGYKLNYPCIIYNLAGIETLYADGKPYALAKKYTVTAITKDPESTLPNSLAMLPTSKFDREFSVDNLHHYVFTLYY